MSRPRTTGLDDCASIAMSKGTAKEQEVSLSLLSTKLYIPPVRPELVPRPRLIERLNAGLLGQNASLSEGRFTRKLTLVSAPAGFGKTTLLSEWVADYRESKIRVAWLSLDAGDNDPARFLAYLIAAFKTIEESVGRGALGALQSPGFAIADTSPPTDELLTTLINQINVIPDGLILVLDDYHLITAPPVHDALSFLLDHLPRNVHLVIATRVDPPLPIARLRGHGQLTELRQTDLRFTLDEIAEFLNQVMGLELSADDVATLASRTEGWITGLQMAAISMQGREDTARFIQAFTGSNRHILDYLVEEVLQRQLDSVQTFLLQTSILDRLTGPLCDATLGIGESASQRVSESASQRISKSASLQADDLQICRFADLPGQEILEYLERANLFVVPLDNERRWYRYHRLFADLLRQRLHQTAPDLVPTLHRRASAWYERNGLMAAAIEHARSAGDLERAVGLIDEHVETLWGRGEKATLSRWLEALPDEMVCSWPRLCVYHAFVLFMAGQLDEAGLRLQAAERVLGSAAGEAAPPGSPGRSHVRSEAALQGMIAAVRAYIAFLQGDVPAIIQFSRQALQYLPDEKSMWRSAVAIVSGDAHSLSGDLVAAGEHYSEAVALSKAAGNIYFVLFASAKLAANESLLGRLHRVAEICQQGLQRANESGSSQTARAGVLYALWGTTLCQWNDLDGALRYARKGVELCERENNVVLLGASYLSLVRVLLARKDVAGAQDAIHKLERLARESDLPTWLTSPAAAWKARMWIAQGQGSVGRRDPSRLEVAARWSQERGLNAGDDLFYLRQEEYLALARLLIAQGSQRPGGPYLEEATGWLERLLHMAEAGGLAAKVIEIMALRALALQAQGDVAQALTALERALSLAEPAGFVRLFVDEGEPMARLLRQAVSRDIAPEYVSRLLAAFDQECSRFRVSDSGPMLTSTPDLEPETPELETQWVAPLSEREFDVLQLLATRLSSAEIAEELYISANTVRFHTKNIYGKLGVHRRSDAVDRARELGLL
jgi:LuxR family maltose regulon positive regulatory protein